jgi:AbrB family looped-hinge helix DNA binding protein
MALATLTTKGQVTIPKEIRDSLKLTTGEKLEILVIDER